MSGGLGRIEFGGPDLPSRRLRDLLQSCVEASPPGSRIDWATYYFRDKALAEALIRASDRGVAVRVVLEPHPRREGTNDAVIGMLAGHGLGGGFHLYRPAPFDDGHLHAKIYAFSDPDIAWVGSFNPSGDTPEDADIIAEIGDQDRGHNLLLGIERPTLTEALRRHAGHLTKWRPVPVKLRPHFNLTIEDAGTRLYLYPRLLPYPAERAIAALRSGDRLHGAISHLKPGELTRQLKAAVRRGVAVELLVHDTERRVPSDLIAELAFANVRIARVRHPDGLPMHAKFLILTHGGDRSAWLGSHNFNKRSRRKNVELLLRTTDPLVTSALAKRFDQIAAMVS